MGGETRDNRADLCVMQLETGESARVLREIQKERHKNGNKKICRRLRNNKRKYRLVLSYYIII